MHKVRCDLRLMPVDSPITSVQFPDFLVTRSVDAAALMLVDAGAGGEGKGGYGDRGSGVLGACK